MQHDVPTAHDDPAMAAFSELRGEIALMRRAVERLAAERADIAIPDYSETLGALAKNGEVMVETYRALIQRPALSLTPDNLAREINLAGEAARKQDHARLLQTEDALEQAIGELKNMMRTVRDVERQGYWLGGVAIAGGLFGMLFLATLNGPVARALPASWLMPEKIAAEALDMPRWDAGARLMETANPESWRQIVQAARLADANRQPLDACYKRAADQKDSVECNILVKEMDIRQTR